MNPINMNCGKHFLGLENNEKEANKKLKTSSKVDSVSSEVIAGVSTEADAMHVNARAGSHMLYKLGKDPFTLMLSYLDFHELINLRKELSKELESEVNKIVCNLILNQQAPTKIPSATAASAAAAAASSSSSSSSSVTASLPNSPRVQSPVLFSQLQERKSITLDELAKLFTYFGSFDYIFSALTNLEMLDLNEADLLHNYLFCLGRKVPKWNFALPIEMHDLTKIVSPILLEVEKNCKNLRSIILTRSNTVRWEEIDQKFIYKLTKLEHLTVDAEIQNIIQGTKNLKSISLRNLLTREDDWNALSYIAISSPHLESLTLEDCSQRSSQRIYRELKEISQKLTKLIRLSVDNSEHSYAEDAIVEVLKHGSIEILSISNLSKKLVKHLMTGKVKELNAGSVSISPKMFSEFLKINNKSLQVLRFRDSMDDFMHTICKFLTNHHTLKNLEIAFGTCDDNGPSGQEDERQISLAELLHFITKSGEFIPSVTINLHLYDFSELPQSISSILKSIRSNVNLIIDDREMLFAEPYTLDKDMERWHLRGERDDN